MKHSSIPIPDRESWSQSEWSSQCPLSVGLRAPSQELMLGNPRETVPINTLTFALSSSLTPLLTEWPLEADDEPWPSNGLEGGGTARWIWHLRR